MPNCTPSWIASQSRNPRSRTATPVVSLNRARPNMGHTWTSNCPIYLLPIPNHYDLSSLMAGKVHALLTRQYSKSRDWCDLLWYRGKVPPVEPNLGQLQKALDQTQGAGAMDSSGWKGHLIETLNDLDCPAIAADVKSFLEHPSDATLITVENIRSVLA